MAKMTLFACGGCGVNIASRFIEFAGKKQPGFAEIQPFFLDTSDSNMPANADKEHIYAIDGLDGSGKKRDENAAIIAERSKEMLHHFKPSDVNIVIHSASGGSGSVIGPLLVSELLSRDAQVIVIMVGSSDSRIEAHNTISTLKTYENISHRRSFPVVAAYYENCEATPRGTVDDRIHKIIVLLSAIFSGENKELDSADLANFLNYPKVTSFKPKLSYLDFFSKDIEVSRDQSIVTVVSLTDEKTSSTPNVPVEYQATGFLGREALGTIGIELPIHATVVSGYYHGVINKLDERLKTIDESRNAYVEKSIIDHTTKHGEGDLIF